MAEQHAAERVSGAKLPSLENVNKLKGALHGELLRPGDDEYESARRIHNGMIDRRPAMIVRCAGVADVMRAVSFAREHEMLVAVRGGGHGVPGFAVCNDGMMIDLSRMKSVRVDPTRRTARAADAGGGRAGGRGRDAGRDGPRRRRTRA